MFNFIYNNQQPIKLGDTANLPNEEWLHWRDHGPNWKNDPKHPVPYIPFAVGGSDVSIVFGESPWTTPNELWAKKTGKFTPPVKLNALQLENGHLQEPIVAHFFSVKEGATVSEDTEMYQHPNYPWALANIDRRFVDKNGREGILEIKTTSYHKASAWDDGQIPYYYELQLRFYMAICNVDYGAFACMWGSNPDTDMAIRYIERDEAKEEEIFTRLAEFIKNCEDDVEPALAGKTPELMLNALAMLYQPANGAPTIQLSERKFGETLKILAELYEEKQKHNQEIKKIDERIEKLSVKVADAMREHEVGEGIYRDQIYSVLYKASHRSGVDTAMLKKDYPEVYEKVKTDSVSRKVKVKIAKNK